MRAPEPLSAAPKTLFEWFLNVYFWFDAEEGGPDDGRKTRCQDAWRRFRRENAGVLQLSQQGIALAWIPKDWEAACGSAPARAIIEAFDTSIEPSSADAPAERQPRSTASVFEEAAQTQTLGSQGEPAALPRCLSSETDDEEEVPAHRARYAKFWQTEIGTDLAGWPAGDVHDFILSVARRVKPTSKARMEAMAKACLAGDVDGRLLLAGGSEILVERTVGHVKWDYSTLKREGNAIMKAAAEVQSRGERTYWDRCRRVRDLYATSDLRDVLKLAMAPHDLSCIRYTLLCTRCGGDRATALTNIDDDVSTLSANPEQLFKVVSVVTPDDPQVVSHNAIYCKDRAGKWVILLSVDFMHHGEAPPGHWHLNRAPLGEFVPHWGPSNDVYHGSPEACPLWWLLIPEGLSYKELPERRPLFTWEGVRGT
eukprot:TRINITY_DN1022_c0_g1_i1.p1 TRINITY_DN1022_c0_g1~~TRINITY_DN1022_c0_g1_i1.p1  ORF type:complete len:449 (+),score=102.50 TRINITY_DN1022_c0_g1_i1:73-1347(+)